MPGHDFSDEAWPVRRLAIHGTGENFADCRFVACIPVRDEAERIARCLAALDAELAPGDGVLIAANGCRDATLAITLDRVAAWTRPWLVLDCDWAEDHGSAPLARRMALDAAHRLAPDAILLSLDGDTLVLPGLRAAYAAEFAAGYDLVCGRIGFLPEEAAKLPVADPASEATIRDYRETSRQIGALLHPDPDNPWPHHGNIGGANFAVTGAAYRKAGPLPTPPFGEDRALRRRAEALGLRIRYSNRPCVETSCRLDGRARDGLSDELRRNRTEPDPIVDELLEPPETLVHRFQARAAFATTHDPARRAAILRRLELSPEDIERLAEAGGGIAWQEAEDLSPVLRRERLRLSDLRRLLPELRRTLVAIRDVRSDNPAPPAR